MKFAAKWMVLERTMLSEMTQPWKDKNHMLSFMCARMSRWKKGKKENWVVHEKRTDKNLENRKHIWS